MAYPPSEQCLGSKNDPQREFTDMTNDHASALFTPFSLGSLELPNRIVMAPMTRGFSPSGIPGPDVAEYYRRRALGGVGLIITEGTTIPHVTAGYDPNVPHFHGDESLAGWKQVVDAVHEAGGRIMPQIWHVGQIAKPEVEGVYDNIQIDHDQQIGPSGMVGSLGEPVQRLGKPATDAQIEAVVEAYAVAAQSAQRLGFDGVEIHGAHGYLLDQFFWDVTNLRDDRYGGSMANRTRLAVEVVRAIRDRVGPDFPIVMRISQWKQQDYGAKLARTPDELQRLVDPLVAAGVDTFHCSQRRFWEGEFGTDLNLAGWVKKLSGKPTITVGSVTLKQDLITTFTGNSSDADTSNLDRLVELFERGDFDLVAVGRALIVDPEWANKVRSGTIDKLKPYSPTALTVLE